MTSSLLIFLILFPLAVALIAFLNRKPSLFAPLVYGAFAVIAVASLMLLGAHNGPLAVMIPAHAGWVEPAMLAAEVLIAVYLLYLAIRQKDVVVALLVAVQAGVLLWFHFGAGHG